MCHHITIKDLQEQKENIKVMKKLVQVIVILIY